MDSWENWKFGPEAEKEIDKISSELDLDSNINDWWYLFNYNFLKNVEDFGTNMEVDNSELSLFDEKDILSFVKESLDTSAVVDETKLIGIPRKSLYNILLSVKNILTEESFFTLCKSVASWSNFILIECILDIIVLPKLKDKQEASSCTIHSIKELALNIPDKLCHIVLIPLLTDNSFDFSDCELLNSIFPVLQPAQQDLIILSLTNKEEFKEKNWLLLHSVTTNLSKSSILEIEKCIRKFSWKFSKSQIFGKFLVHFCRNLNFIENKNLLIEAIEKHETLLKRQALKYLELL